MTATTDVCTRVHAAPEDTGNPDHWSRCPACVEAHVRLDAAEDAAAEVAPAPFERGRYAVYPDGQGGAGIYRAVYLCDRCDRCGCGEQQPPIPIPAMVLPFITGDSTPRQRIAAFRKMLKGMLGKDAARTIQGMLEAPDNDT